MFKRRPRQLFGGAFVASLLITSCSFSDPVVAPAEPEPEMEVEAETTTVTEAEVQVDVDLDAIDEQFEGWADEFDGGGVGLVQFGDGSIHLLDAGEDAASGEPLSAQSDRVRVGSISKVFIATLVMQLVEDGLVDLDGSASAYVSDVVLDEAITVRHLLGHESGIPNYTEDRDLIGLILEDPLLELTPQDLLGYVEADSDFAPGSQFTYSNSNFIVAGLLVEAVTNQTLNDALAEQITDPLGLTETEFDDGTFDDVVAGYSIQVAGGQTGASSYQSMADASWAAGSMVTTVPELATFFNALYVDDELLAPELLDEMFDGVSGRFEYGLGTHAGPDFGVGHGGSIFGFNSIAEVDPDTGEMVIVVANNDGHDPVDASGLITEVAGFG